MRTYLNFVFPSEGPPKERILKVFVSHLLANTSRENETIRLMTMSFLQDKVSFTKKKVKDYYKLLKMNPFETISALIVPVNEAQIEDYYLPIESFLAPGASMSVASLKQRLKADGPLIFLYTSIVFTNEVIKANFSQQQKRSEEISQKMNDFISQSGFTASQKQFLNLIRSSFSRSRILTLRNVKHASLELKLYLISILAVFHSITDQSNFLQQIATQLRSRQLKSIFLNVSNMFDINERAKVEVTKLWKCKNCNNIFGLGNCGRPWEIFKCVCGVDIGGHRHVATPNTIELTPEEQRRYSPSANRYNIHEYLRDSHKTFLSIHPLCFRFLHSFIHGLYLGWVETGFLGLDLLGQLLLPNLQKDFGHLRVTDNRDYFLRHIEVDFDVIQSMRNKNYKEYNLLTSLLVSLFGCFAKFSNCKESMEDYNKIAADIGNSFSSMITGNNRLSIEAKIEKFLRESTTNIKNEEAEIIMRSVEFARISEHRLNEFLFYHLRNIATPSVADFVEYMNKNVELRDKATFIEFHINHRGMMDAKFLSTFFGLRDMCVFMNNHLQNELRKEEMSRLRVVDFIGQVGRADQKRAKCRAWTRAS